MSSPVPRPPADAHTGRQFSRPQHRRWLIPAGGALLLAVLTGWFVQQDHLDPKSFLHAVGWAEKPNSRLILPESGITGSFLPRSGPDFRTGLLNMLRSDRFGTPALLIPGGQNPAATPVIFIHGLMSTPSMWAPVVADLQQDPTLAAHYQFWFFYYPTGQPIPLTALQFRETLDEARRLGCLPRPAVLIGHSMGGIVARAQVVGLQREEAESILPGLASLEENHLARQSLIFQPRNDIGRLIFIATPHRGTDFASRPISRLGHQLIRLPDWLEEEVAVFQEELPVLAGRQFPTSILGLSPNSPFLRQLDQGRMITPAHSIIPLLEDPASDLVHDGIVPLWSSRLPVAESELLIPGHHGSFATPESLAELRRILRLHADLPNP